MRRGGKPKKINHENTKLSQGIFRDFSAGGRYLRDKIRES
jgi:hypothetical protein